MDWDFIDDCVIWTASSEQNDDGDRFTWRIVVNRDGLFCVDDSDAELTDRKAPFKSLAEAKAFCQASEGAWWGNASSSAQQRKDDEARDDWFTREELDRALPQ